MVFIRAKIRKLLIEAFCKNVNSTISNAIDIVKAKGYYFYVFQNDENGILITLKDNHVKYGERNVGMLKLVRKLPDIDLNTTHRKYCNNSYIAGSARIYDRELRNSGVGALLYDVALELAGDNGVSGDRYGVSEYAIRMYKYFYNSPDYDKKYLDPNKETRKKEDDCPSDSIKGHTNIPFLPHKKYSQWGHPLAYTYIKKPGKRTTIDCLEEMGLITGLL